MNHTLFISDLHLEPQRPEMNQLFLKFLDSMAFHADGLYILGDFFEAWVGDDDANPFHGQIESALKNLSQSIPVYLMHGNRDFLLGKDFSERTGVKLLPDEIVVDLYGTPTLLLHGDTLCTDDIKYQAFRQQVRNPAYQQAFLTKPLEERLAIAKQLRQSSQEHTATTADSIMDVNEAEVQRVMTQHNVKQLIHGHTHRPHIHEFELDGCAAKRIVLGAWHDRGSVLIAGEDGSISLETL